MASPVSMNAGASADGLRGRALWMAALSISIGMVCANLDMSIVQNALPSLSIELHMDSSKAVSIVTIYMLATLTLLLPFAPLSDRVGYKRFYLAGFLVFIGASLLCGVAGNAWELQCGRLLQGIGSAAMMCSTTSLLRIVYPRAMMARAIGSNSTVVAVSLAAAPSLSAFILTHLSWHWLFLINLPLGLVACLLGWRALPASAAQLPNPTTSAARTQWRAVFAALDWADTLLNIVFFALLLAGTEALGRRPLFGVGLLGAAALLGWWFVRRQLRAVTPMLPFDLLRERSYALTIATSFASFAAQGAAFVSLPFYFQRTLHYSLATTGLLLTAWPIALAVSSQLAARLSQRVPVAYLCAVGQALLGLGLALVATRVLPAEPGVLATLLAISGAGFGLFQTPNNTVIVRSAPADRSGAVGALRAATRTCGQLLGAAFTGLMFLVSQASGVLDGATLGLYLAAALAAWASVCSLGRSAPGVRSSNAS
jgi:DHA2 family multidrug resistance protein-like MFS transporter